MSDTMTRKEALTALKEKVEAGEHVPWYSRSDPCEMGQARRYVGQAHEGSLDAALALHESVLPGWIWRVNHSIDGWDVRLKMPMNIKVQTAVSFDSPARAWLIAIIKALIEQETGE